MKVTLIFQSIFLACMAFLSVQVAASEHNKSIYGEDTIYSSNSRFKTTFIRYQLPQGQTTALDKEDFSEEDYEKEFMWRLDKDFFTPPSSQGITASNMAIGLTSGAAGLVVPHPTCGSLIYYAGDFMRIPHSKGLSYGLIAWTVSTSSPVYFRQFCDRSLIITRSIRQYFQCCGDRKLYPKVSEEDKSKPQFIQISKFHTGLKWVVLGASALHNLTPLKLMLNAEHDFLNFSYGTGPFFYASGVENYYRMGILHLDQLFLKHSYSDPYTQVNRRILKKHIENLKAALKDDRFVQRTYRLIQTAKNKKNPDTAGLLDIVSSESDDDEPSHERIDLEKGKLPMESHPFCLSVFFMQSVNKLDLEELSERPLETHEDQLDTVQSRTMNYKVDFLTLEGSLKDSFASWINTAIVGGSTLARYGVVQHTIQSILESFGINSYNAYIAAGVTAAFDTAFRSFAEQTAQQNYSRKITRIFSRGFSDLWGLRKTTGLFSFLNGVLYSLPNVVAGLTVFSDQSLTSQFLILLPAFLTDLAYHDEVFNHAYQENITTLGTLPSNPSSISMQRIWLSAHANKILSYLDKWDDKTINQLYKIVGRGL